ncbi:uncharacterized protein TRUGW13939_01882 [Talaromyces rugulosus]|uniref:Uncharacterized protein n=1 Tax=Talaromyces rugulosus TaxID=121627 RepID=A0A7H8QNN9_TALRU|nr:uncharacterized protein TRUGW13939_01882 [Talaromyces rugulosus]QKX54793.1 hypothetical protein TRUGW13939_01882 [Talaromyces rugulosus]
MVGKKFNKKSAKVLQQYQENERNLAESAEITSEAWPGVAYLNQEVTSSALKGVRLRRLQPKAAALSELVDKNGSADTNALSKLVEDMKDASKQPTKDDAKEFLELLELTSQLDATNAKTWAEKSKGEGTGEAQEFVSIWEDIKGNKNGPATTVGNLMQRLKNNKTLLEVVKSLAK